MVQSEGFIRYLRNVVLDLLPHLLRNKKCIYVPVIYSNTVILFSKKYHQDFYEKTAPHFEECLKK